MSRLVVLMYHALYDGADELERIEGSERPYAVALDAFHLHLDYLVTQRIPVLSLSEALSADSLPRRAVMLTFDDGHVSWYRYALPLLRERNLAATFFVTSDLVGTRDDFCSWAQLTEIARAGMAVQVHGRTHRFFDDLSEQESLDEFEQAKAAIERHTANTVQSMSFPGGRYLARDLAIGRAAGYRLFFTSDVGANSRARVARRQPIRRMAIRRDTSMALFEQIVAADPALMLRGTVMAGMKRTLRRIIGNRRYQAWYEQFSA